MITSGMRHIIGLQVRKKLYYFLRKAFATVNPSVPFCANWHLELMCDVLESCVKRENNRVIINLPPRYLKSMCVSVALPAWLLGIDPSERVIICSYSQALSAKHAADCRRIMKSDWYGEIFPNSKIVSGKDTKTRFGTSANGYYFATSIGGTLLGDGGSFLIVDDPQTPETVNVKKHRNRVIDWFRTSLISRLDDKANGVIVIVMQRLHSNDLSGHLLEINSSEWLHVKLPAIAILQEDITFNNKLYCCRMKDDPLHPSRDNAAVLRSMEGILGSYAFRAQYQQEPIVSDDGLIKEDWIMYYKDDNLRSCGGCYISIDCAKSLASGSDYTAIAVFGLGEDGIHLLVDMIRIKVDYPSLKKKVCGLIDKFKPNGVLIEDTSNGSSLIQELQFLGYSNIIPIKVRNDKVSRFNHALIAIESGRLLFPERATFLTELLPELLSFPLCQHDDQVDSISQYFLWMNSRRLGTITPKIRMM